MVAGVGLVASSFQFFNRLATVFGRSSAVSVRPLRAARPKWVCRKLLPSVPLISRMKLTSAPFTIRSSMVSFPAFPPAAEYKGLNLADCSVFTFAPFEIRSF